MHLPQPAVLALLTCLPLEPPGLPTDPERYLEAVPPYATVVVLVPDVAELVGAASRSTWATFAAEHVLGGSWGELIGRGKPRSRPRS